jgi:cation:H+ antiporter
MAETIITDLVLNVLIIGISFLALNWASNLSINNAVKVSRITQLGKTAIGFSLIAFSTSLPELTVAVIAVFSGGTSLSIGNVLGSNIVNISVVVGLAAVILSLRSRRRTAAPSEINVLQGFAKTELGSIHFGLFISSVIPLALIYINTATWVVGIVLIGIFIAYIYQLSKVRVPSENGLITVEEKAGLRRFVLLTIVGALGVVVSAYFLVESAVSIAQGVGVPQTVIGATIIAFGTSLPEITLDLKSFLRGHAGLAFGDIIGSSFVNITLILGITLFVPVLVGAPVNMNMSVFQNLVLFSIIVNLFFWYFLSRERIGWREGAMFLFIYGLFLATTLQRV